METVPLAVRGKANSQKHTSGGRRIYFLDAAPEPGSVRNAAMSFRQVRTMVLVCLREREMTR